MTMSTALGTINCYGRGDVSLTGMFLSTGGQEPLAPRCSGVRRTDSGHVPGWTETRVGVSYW